MRQEQITTDMFLQLLGVKSTKDGFTFMLDKTHFVKMKDLSKAQIAALGTNDKAHISLHDTGGVRQSNNSIVRTRVLMYMDIDTFDETVWATNWSKLQEMNLLPTIVTRTNSGYHFIWVSPVDLTDVDVKRMNTIAKRIKSLLVQVDRTSYSSYTRYSNTLYPSWGTAKDDSNNVLVYSLAEFEGLVNNVLQANNLNLDTYIDDEKVSVDVFTETLSYCKVLGSLVREAESHTYQEWMVVALYYANLHVLYAEAEGSEDPIYKNTFLQISSAYENYNEGQASNLFISMVDMIKGAKGIVFYSCAKLALFRPDACKQCTFPCKGMSYTKKAKVSKIVSELSNYIIEDGNLLVVESSGKNKTQTAREISRAFKIVDVFNVIQKNTLVKQVVTIAVDKGDQGTVNFVDTIKLDTNTPNALATYVEAVGDKKEVEQYYKLIRKEAETQNLPGYIGVSASEYKILGVNVEKRFMQKVYHTHAPEAAGDADLFFKKLSEYLWDNEIDAIAKLSVGFSMLAILAVNDSYSYMLSNLNPVLLFIGKTGTGKTTRVRIGNALWRNPNQILTFASQTQASIMNRLSMVKAMLYFDEFIVDKNNLNEVTNTLYMLANRAGKDTAYESHEPLRGSVQLTGEVHNLRNWKDSGLSRRLLKVMLDKEHLEKSTDKINKEYLPFFAVHYGHIYPLNAYTNSRADQLKEEYKVKSQQWHILGLQSTQISYVITSLIMIKMFLLMMGYRDADAEGLIQHLFSDLQHQLKLEEDEMMSTTADEVASSMTSIAELAISRETIAQYTYSEIEKLVIMDAATTASKAAVKIMASQPVTLGTGVKYNVELHTNPLITVKSMGAASYASGKSDQMIVEHFTKWAAFIKHTNTRKFSDTSTWELVATNITVLLREIPTAFPEIQGRDREVLGHKILSRIHFPDTLLAYFQNK